MLIVSLFKFVEVGERTIRWRFNIFVSILSWDLQQVYKNLFNWIICLCKHCNCTWKAFKSLLVGHVNVDCNRAIRLIAWKILKKLSRKLLQFPPENKWRETLKMKHISKSDYLLSFTSSKIYVTVSEGIS